jgi:23S rRNA pseudouridine2457 synthase
MEFKYYKIYKPFGMLSQFSKDGDKAVLGELYDFPKDVYPIGRLDTDSEGLLLLTNNRSITHRLLDPQFGHKRTYLAQVEGEITDEAIEQLQSPLELKHKGKVYVTKPATAKKLTSPPALPERNPPIRYRKNVPDSWIELTLTEGKNRQVRKMTAAVGFPTLRLVRWSIEEITIEGMGAGAVRELSELEKNAILKS